MEIKDSGTRREFSTGAVRDIAEGKGRCDLLPLDVVGLFADDKCRKVFDCIDCFVRTHKTDHLMTAIDIFGVQCYGDRSTMLLEVAKHFEAGCQKYGERNWEKGINVHCYVDSGVRHLLKYLRRDTDEPHDRAFVWNMLCCIWTMIHHPELNDLPKVKGE